jgi:ABC-type transport system substrate-binding protein
MAKINESGFTRRDFLKTTGALAILAAAGSSLPLGVFSGCESEKKEGLPEIRFTYADTASNGTIAQFLQGQMQDNLGVTIILDPMESSAYQSFVNAESHQWAWFGWGADYPDPENFINPNFVTGAGNNHTGYSSAEVDALAASGLKELDNTKRLKYWSDAQEIIVDDCPALFMFNRERFYLVNPRVQGLTPTGMDGGVMGDQFWTAVSMKSGEQTLTVNLNGEPNTIDPNKASWATSRSVLAMVFEGLLGFDKDLNLIAVGATEIPTVANGGISSDGLTYTFKLNPAVTWSDGQVVKAADYEYSIKRFLDPDLACEYASMYLAIVGATAYNAAVDDDAALRGAYIAGHDIHRRRLPGAVRPEKPVDLPFFDLEAQMVHGNMVPVVLDKIMHFDQERFLL